MHPLLASAGVQQLLQGFDLLPDTLFWVKDRDSRVAYANQFYLEHVHARSLEAIVGKSDLEFFPTHLATQYVQDDQKVMQGASVTDRLELNLDQQGKLGWFLTNKRPLHSIDGEIIGSYGVTRHLDKTSIALSNLEAIRLPVAYIREHYSRPISISELAEIAHLSVSALERRFKKYLGKTPNQFMNEMRLESARRQIIETDAPISDIAYAVGFSEPSYFSKQFKSLFGKLPSEIREQLDD